MSKYEDMTKAQLMECIEMASEDAHADAKRQRWTKAVLVEWLNGFAEQTDVAPSVAEESESAETESTQTDTHVSTISKSRWLRLRTMVKWRTTAPCGTKRNSSSEIMDGRQLLLPPTLLPR